MVFTQLGAFDGIVGIDGTGVDVVGVGVDELDGVVVGCEAAEFEVPELDE